MSLHDHGHASSRNEDEIAECESRLKHLYTTQATLIHHQRTLQTQRTTLIQQIWSNPSNADSLAHERAGNALRKISFAASEHAIDAAADALNAAHCRALVPSFYANLPRELRDMVYAYLTSDDVYVDRTVMPHASRPLKKEDVAYLARYPRSRGDLLCVEHFWRDEVVGAQVARELMESWYRCSVFHVRDRRGLRMDGERPLQFLELDRFGAGLDPRLFVSKVLVKAALSCNRFGEPVAPGRVVDDLAYCLGKLRRGALVRVLLEVEHLVGFHCSEFEQWLERLLQVVVSLRREKLRVDVELCLGGFVAGPRFPREDFVYVLGRWRERVERKVAAVP